MNIDLKRPFRTSAGRVAFSATLALASAVPMLGYTYPSGGVDRSNVWCSYLDGSGPSELPDYCTIFYSNDTYCGYDTWGRTWITGAVCN